MASIAKQAWEGDFSSSYMGNLDRSEKEFSFSTMRFLQLATYIL